VSDVGRLINDTSETPQSHQDRHREVECTMVSAARAIPSCGRAAGPARYQRALGSNAPLI